MAEKKVWEIKQKSTGRTMKVQSVNAPTPEQAAKLWAKVDADKKPPEKPQAYGLAPVAAAATGTSDIASGVIGAAATGAGALVDAVTPGDGNRAAEWGSAAFDKSKEIARNIIPQYQETPQGKAEMEVIGKNIASIPGVEQAISGYDKFKGYIQGQTRRMGEGGSTPFEQTMVESAALGGPEGVLTASGLKGTASAASIGREGIKEAAYATEEAFKQAAKSTETAVKVLTNAPEYRLYDDTGLFTQESQDIMHDLFTKRLNENRRVAQQAREMKSAGEADEAIDAFMKKALGLEGVLSPKEMETYNLFQRTKVSPTRANITQSTDDWRIQQDMSKQSNKISEKVAQQENQLADAAARVKERTGGAAITNDRKGISNRVFTAIDSTVQKYDDAVTQAYAAARELSPIGKSVKLDNLVGTARRNLAVNDTAGVQGIPNAIIKILRRDGILPEKGYNVQGRIDVQTAERIRQEINALYPDAKGQGRMIIHDLKEALDDDVAAVVGGDVFKDARQAKIDFHKLIERDKNKRDQSRGSFVQDIVYGKIAPEQIIDKLGSSSVRFPDAVKFRKFLLEDAGPEGQQLWHDMRAQIIEDAMTKAMSSKGVAEGGVQVFKGDVFKNHILSAVNGSNDKARYNLFFNPDEQAMINDIAEVSSKRIPMRSVALGSGPSGAAVESAIAAAQAGQLNVFGLPVGHIARGSQRLYGAILNREKIKDINNPVRQTEDQLRNQIYEQHRQR